MAGGAHGHVQAPVAARFFHRDVVAEGGEVGVEHARVEVPGRDRTLRPDGWYRPRVPRSVRWGSGTDPKSDIARAPLYKIGLIRSSSAARRLGQPY